MAKGYWPTDQKGWDLFQWNPRKRSARKRRKFETRWREIWGNYRARRLFRLGWFD